MMLEPVLEHATLLRPAERGYERARISEIQTVEPL